MKLRVMVFLSMVMLTAVLQGAEQFFIVKLTDMIGGVGYKVMSADEYKKAFQEVQEEMRVFPAVLADCKKEWSADKERTEAFPSSKIKVRKIAKGGATYPSVEKATLKLERLEDGLTADRLAVLDKHAKSFKNMDERTHAREAAKLTAFKDGFELVAKKMEEKLGRPVENFGFDLIIPEPKAKP
ncbi:MAG: hypothetical protein PHO37_04375 [Kiritimatiellae bacterium]|nr:hypothetical protein [Kiritimatiellia bacterium]